MSREVHVRFWERAEVRSLRATHFPLYRQAEICARDGLDLDRGLLADWVGKAAWLLRPLADRIGAHVMFVDIFLGPAGSGLAFGKTGHPECPKNGPLSRIVLGLDAAEGGARAAAVVCAAECSVFRGGAQGRWP